MHRSRSEMSFEMQMLEFALEAVIASTNAAVNDCSEVRSRV